MNKQEVLSFITDAPGIIVGQLVDTGSKTFPDYWETNIVSLQAQTGKWPGLIGFDFGWGNWDTDPTWLKNLIAYWNAGGLIAVGEHFPHPWGGKYSDAPSGPISDLWTPGKVVCTTWRAHLAKVVSRMRTLTNAGVVPLWRPFHEMNGSVGNGWWKGLPVADFVKLWQSTHEYFDSAGITNLLWVFSPQRKTSPAPQTYYPGRDWCDIVGLDVYGNNLDAVPAHYSKLLEFGKPFVLGEFGPGSGSTQPSPNTFDYGRLLDMIATKCPLAKYFMVWTDNYAIVKQNGAGDLMNDARAITREKIGIVTPPPPPPPVTDASAELAAVYTALDVLKAKLEL